MPRIDRPARRVANPMIAVPLDLSLRPVVTRLA